MSENLGIYRNKETRSKLLSFYNRTLATWPVPYEDLLVQTPYGNTHVIVPKPVLSCTARLLKNRTKYF
jgi:hypothetical protein